MTTHPLLASPDDTPEPEKITVHADRWHPAPASPRPAGCPACQHDVSLDENGCIEGHDSWGQGGAYAVRCPASGRRPDELSEGDTTCLARPPDCRECSKDESNCECYTHQNDHPDDAEGKTIGGGHG